MGTCPRCDNDFRLVDAILFAIDEAPPEGALAAIQAALEAVKDRKREIVEARERMSTKAARTSQAVNIGKIVEKIVPSFASFQHSPGDCRALFEPIDYLIFSGLTKNGKVDSLLFVDVKSGNARLNGDQRAIKDAIEAGSVDFATINHARDDG
jgi:predicted Holliday junction resolvase-like endonuclease